MAISTDYPRPINVNGYVCRNCDDVSDARKFIDPAAPKDLSGVPATDDSAVTFGGSLADQKSGTRADTRPVPHQLVDRYA